MCKQWSIFSPVCQIGVLAIKIFVMPLLGYDAESWLTEQFSWKGPLEGILSKPAQSWANFGVILGSSASCWPQTSQFNTELLTSHLQITIKVILKLCLETANCHLLTFISLSHTVRFWLVPWSKYRLPWTACVTFAGFMLVGVTNSGIQNTLCALRHSDPICA